MNSDVIKPSSPTIDLEFIQELEGSLHYMTLKRPSGDKNEGLIVAESYDLGGKNENDLRHLQINPTLLGKLYPYLGLKGSEASEYYNTFPLELSNNELLSINMGLKFSTIRDVFRDYEYQSGVDLQDIPPAWQTVIASIVFQYDDIETKWPTFWQTLLQQQWEEALEQLQMLDGHMSERRHKEVNYIQKSATT